ncbi:hypothetical protein P0G10_20050, partial [Eubacteriales bacterium DFI.9.88]|nr:hypothetical protein [Eubacteriales bacterium DFI.9.88]
AFPMPVSVCVAGLYQKLWDGRAREHFIFVFLVGSFNCYKQRRCREVQRQVTNNIVFIAKGITGKMEIRTDAVDALECMTPIWKKSMLNGMPRTPTYKR